MRRPFPFVRTRSRRRRSCVAVLAPLLCAGCGSAASTPATATDGSDGGADNPVTMPSGDGGVATQDGVTAASDASADAATRPTSDGGPAATCAAFEPTGGVTSKWAEVGASGKLTYATLPTGERLLDFSGAGYMGGGVALPTVPVSKTLSPSGGDDTAAIQAAIDAVAKLPLQSGVRGAVLLAPGTFELAGSLSIDASGVVLRGSGSGSGGTLVNVTGSPRMVFTLTGTGSWTEGTATTITDSYVPSGARTFHVASAAGLSVGKTVLVDRPVTAAWVQFMGMADMVRNGTLETWISVGSVAHEDRTISGIAGDAITLDMPVSDTFDSKYTSGSVAPYTFAGRIEQVGLEAMHVVAPKQSVPINQPIFGVAELSAVQDAWVRDVVADEFTTGIVVDGTAKWVTLQDSTVERTAPIDGMYGYPFDYSVDGQAVLVLRCTASGDNVFSYATQDRANGPNVVLDFTVKGTPINLQPHQRWATGLLLDNIQTPTGGIGLMNRGWDGSGHGWAIGFGVLWNGVASGLLVQQPPGSMNWAIGSSGTLQMSAAPGSASGSPPLPEGTIDSPGKAVSPRSLYLAQLCERLGPGAVHAIGY
jgi:hypothetical protein